MDEADLELGEDDFEVLHGDGSITYHKGEKKTVGDIKKEVENSPGFAENTIRSRTRFAVVVEKAV
jgi:hypothetical protein